MQGFGCNWILVIFCCEVSGGRRVGLAAADGRSFHDEVCGLLSLLGLRGKGVPTGFSRLAVSGAGEEDGTAS